MSARYAFRTCVLVVLSAAPLVTVAAYWTHCSSCELAVFATGVCSAFIGGLLLTMNAGLVLGMLSVITAGLVVEKDRSGLGPTALIVPLQLLIAAIPILLASWGGNSLRTRLSDSVDPNSR